MPTMANITIKKKDGTTDVVWSASQPSAGDKTPAKWRSNTVHSVLGFRPVFQMACADNADGSGRRITVDGAYPLIATENGVEVRKGIVPFKATMLIPQFFTDPAQLDEAIYQFGNLLVSSLVRQSIQEGFAPT